MGWRRLASPLKTVFFDDNVEVLCIVFTLGDVFGKVISASRIAESDDMATVLSQ